MWQPNGNQVLAQRAWVSGALYSEADFESTTVPLYAFALNFESNDFHRTTTGDDLKSNVVGIDGVYKFKGFSTTGEYFYRKRTPETAREVRLERRLSSGRHDAQSVPHVGSRRSGTASASSRIASTTTRSRRSAAGINYYYRRHTLKFQMDFGRVETGLGATDGNKRKDYELRLQAQFIF